jgi:arylsulfatase A-like enzyme
MTPLRAHLALHALLALALLALAPARSSAQTSPEAEPLNLIIIALDTFRADHLGCYGNSEVKTPYIDGLARESVLFEHAYAPATWTLPSFASTFTGLYPYHHGTVGGDHSHLDESIPTLASVLDEAGYDNSAWVAVSWLSKTTGVTRGFDRQRTFWGTEISTRLYEYREELNRFLRKPPKRPYYVLAHYFDTHAPYRPPKPYDRMYYAGDERDPAHRSLAAIHEPTNRALIHADPDKLYGWLEGVTDIEFPAKQYAAAITHLDNYIGEVLRHLRRSGEIDKSIIMLMADHGEHLTEHDIYFTHALPYEECLRVPFMVRLPGGRGGGRRVAEDVSLVDVMPTILELLGLPIPDGLDGVSLAATVTDGASPPPRVLFAEHGDDDRRNMFKAAWDREHRLIYSSLAAGESVELYDRSADPLELHDLAESNDEAKNRLLEALWTFFDPEHPIHASPVEPKPIDPELKERLRSLGYTP